MDNLLKKTEFELLGETRDFIFGKKKVVMDVVKIPLSYLSYNKNNGRIFLGVNEREKSGVDLDSLDREGYNDEIESIIWDYDPSKNSITYNSIKDYGQLEIALVSQHGVIIDGNRRFTCLRRLHRDFPDSEEFGYLKACILEDPEITPKDIKRYELNVQFGKERQADYHLTDRVMSIYNEVNKEVEPLSPDEIAEEMNESKSTILQTVKIAELINELLEVYHIPGNYYIIDKLDLVNPLAELAKYLKSKKHIEPLSSVELNFRKHIFFHLAVGGKHNLPTQELRNKLIKNIYKNKDEMLAKDFTEEYENEVLELVNDYILTINFEEYKTVKKAFQESEAGKKMNDLYEKYCIRGGLKRTIDDQLLLVEKAKQNLEEVDLELFNSLSGDHVANVFDSIKEALRDINELVKVLMNSE